MRTKITVISISTMALFVFAIANANVETGSSNSMPSDQQAGALGESQPQTVQPGQPQSGSGSMSQPQANIPTTCTDASGVVFQKGTQGFDRCRSETQEGGTAGSESQQLPSGSSDPSMNDRNNTSDPNISE